MVLTPAPWGARRDDTGRADETRSTWEIDYARVIHSASFRRLQGKTQILSLGDSDFYRTRLTHSLEVAQIAGGLVSRLEAAQPDHPATQALPDRALVQTLGCAHDLGHPPFGHGGETALNWCMQGNGGFEGNGQTLRILARLESSSETAGANLSRRAMLGVLKYPVAYSAASNGKDAPKDVGDASPPKCYLDSEADVVKWVLAPLPPEDRTGFCETLQKTGKGLKPLHKSLDCSIMDLADDIAYGVHDLEDALALQFIGRDTLENRLTPDICGTFLNNDRSFDDVIGALLSTPVARKKMIGALVHHFITEACYQPAHHDGQIRFEDPLLAHRVTLAAGPKAFLQALKDLVYDEVIRSPEVQQLEFKGQRMVVSVFEAFASAPARLLPRQVQARLDADGSPRAICDFIAAMTDGALLKTYERLFSPRMGSVFDRL